MSDHTPNLGDAGRDLLARLMHLRELGRRCVAAGDLGEFHGAVLDMAMAITQADFASLLLLDPHTDQVRLVCQRGFSPELVAYFSSLSEGACTCAQAMRARERIIVEDIRTDDRLDPAWRAGMLRAGVLASQSTPLRTLGHQVVGVLSTHARRPSRPSDAELRLVDLVAREAACVLEECFERRALEEALLEERGARRRADLENRRKDQFLATLAHEIRQPLGAALPALEVQKQRISREDGQRARELVERQLRHIARLVDDLADASRIALGDISLHPETVDLRAIVGDAVDTTLALFTGRDQTIVTRVGSAPVWVSADPARITQVFSNLLHNAARYAPRGGRILVSVNPGDGHAVVSVRDNGIGMSPATLARIFEPFERGPALELDDDPRSIGIGLAVVRRLVDLHGGEVTARSAGLGHGSELIVRLPIVRQP